jgi:hypothetical protein
MDLTQPAIIRISQDPAFGGYLPGGVYDRPVERSSVPTAFDPETKEIRVCASLTSTWTHDPSGPADTAVGVLTIWIRGPETAAGRAAVRSARSWLAGVLTARPLALGDGTGVILRKGDGIDCLPDPRLDNTVLSTLRMQTAGIW